MCKSQIAKQTKEHKHRERKERGETRESKDSDKERTTATPMTFQNNEERANSHKNRFRQHLRIKKSGENTSKKNDTK